MSTAKYKCLVFMHICQLNYIYIAEIINKKYKETRFGRFKII